MEENIVRPTAFSILKKNARAKKLIDEIAKSNCPLNPDYNFAFERCEAEISGAFDDHNSQIVICTNNIRSEKHLEQTLSECLFLRQISRFWLAIYL